MKAIVALFFAVVAFAAAEPWQVAAPGLKYEFPRDHHAHPGFKTEWWYFTGNLNDASGRRFGYELTFFRQGIIPPAQRDPTRSRFVVNDLKFAHFTVTDALGRKFYFDQKASRGAFGEAGFDRGSEIAWIDPWRLRETSGGFEIAASTKQAEIRLVLVSKKPPVIHGKNGISVKVNTGNHASHYYSLTRLATEGEMKINGRTFAVKGESWFDHEWATNQLAPGQVGWDWICAQFSDGSDLMLYQIRRQGGSRETASSGTFVAADGAVTHLSLADYRMSADTIWRSGKTGARYPVAQTIEIPPLGLKFSAKPVLNDQELVLSPLIYWEGAMDFSGERNGKPIDGHGYLELTGYAAPLTQLGR